MTTEYAQGGHISGGTSVAWITPDECLIRPDVSGSWHCVRDLHLVDPDLCQERRPR